MSILLPHPVCIPISPRCREMSASGKLAVCVNPGWFGCKCWKFSSSGTRKFSGGLKNYVIDKPVKWKFGGTLDINFIE